MAVFFESSCVIIVFFVCVMVLSVGSEPTEDKQALLAFLSNTPHANRVQWNASVSICNWVGVGCDPNLSFVHTLRLPSVGLVGPIPPNTLGKLSQLRVLSLRSNRLSGQFPSDFSNLTLLRNLYLQDNEFSGEFPASVTGMTRLTRLDLSSNNFTGAIPFTVNNLTHLTGLLLGNNRFSGNLPSLNLSSLSSLDLSGNFLTGIERLSLENLQFLDLSFNLLRGLLPPLPSSLYFFSVAHNNMTGAIPSSFCNLSSIEYLLLSNNSLYGRVPQCLGNYTTILVLDLRMNNFHGNIPQTFSNGSRLTTLNLNGNQFEGSLPPSLVNCVNLEVLDLGNNMINDTFPHWLATLQQLQVLILRSNKFYGAIGDSTTRLRFSMLRILDLSHNGFSGPLPTRFFRYFEAMMSRKNNSAEMRYMGDRYYQDSVVVTMKGIEIKMERILTIFTTMDLSCNKFRGRIPNVVGKLNSLKILNFSHNSLTGRISVSMGNLKELESLDLSSNMLEGEIPTQLTNLISLSVLNLSHNQLAGLIPQGKQFNTFENGSYMGNLGLCGFPLSEKCSIDEAPELEPTKFHEEEDTWSWFDWKIIMMGYGSGLVIGLSMGYIVFSTGKPWWFVGLVERKVIKLYGRRGRRRN